MTHKQPQVSQFKSKSGVKRIYAACLYSMQGLRTAWKSEHAFRQELMLAVPASVLALLLPVPALHKVALIGVLVLVLIVELINSAIEAAIDRISFEPHSLSKNAKDFGSAAVFLAMALAGVTWCVILYPLLFP